MKKSISIIRTSYLTLSLPPMFSNLKAFVRSKAFLVSIVLAVVVIGGSMMLLGSWLSDYTHHGESITVPDLRGMTEQRLKSFIEDKHLRYKIVDSLFEIGKAAGTVIEQDPAPDSKVKEERTIYLTVNSSKPPKVKMPNLVDVSLRQAEAILQTYGLQVGQTIYKPDLAKNAVLRQLYRGSAIAPGAEIYKGSTIDLVLGDGMGISIINVPSLIGQTKSEAMFVLRGSALNIGTIIFDDGVKNQETAKIYKQYPEAGAGNTIKQGEGIDLWLR